MFLWTWGSPEERLHFLPPVGGNCCSTRRCWNFLRPVPESAGAQSNVAQTTKAMQVNC